MRPMHKQEPPARIKVAVVDDQKDFRENLTFLINSASGLECVAACDSADEATTKLPDARPDVVLLDIQLSEKKTGIDLIKPLKKALPGTRIVMLTVVEDSEKLFQAIRCGADGYMLKSTPLRQLPKIIQEAADGTTPLSPEVATLMLRSFQPSIPSRAAMEALTPREMEVIELLAQGCEAKEIAEKLGNSPETVRTIKKSIFAKLHVNTGAEAVREVYPQKSHLAVVRPLPQSP